MKRNILVMILAGFIISSLPLFGDWVEDSQFKFKINVPNNWQKNSFDEGTDRIHAFVSPDQNLAIRIRAFKVNSNVKIDIIANLFKTSILGECEQLALMEHSVNGYKGKIGGYKGVYNGTEVAAGAFFTIQNSIAYIVWSLAPVDMFQSKAAESDAITATFTIIARAEAPASDKSSVSLSNVFDDENLGYSINYPGDWVWVKTKPHIVVFSGRKGIPAFYSTVNIQNLASTLMGGNFNSTDEVIAHFEKQFKDGAQNLQMTNPQTFTFQSNSKNITGKAFQLSYTRQNENFQQLMVIVPRADQKVFYAWMYTAPAEDYEKYYSVAVEMLNTWIFK
ncbi:hypothetical protein J7K93_05745 [bacterium]|nr:hypothetical protein [bacterium]